MILNKDSAKKLFKRASRVVSFDEYEVKILALSIPDQLEIEDILHDEKKRKSLIVEMLKRSCVDENDELFLDDELIKSIPVDVASKIFNACSELNAFSKTELEEKAKNS